MFKANQWYKSSTLYQVLMVDFHKTGHNPSKILNTTLTLKSRGEFNTHKLDDETRTKLQEFPKAPNSSDVETIASYLPSPGIGLKKDFLDTLSPSCDNQFDNEIVNNNFYYSMRILLRGRKISQLIAKTWDAYYQAKKENQGQFWSNFCEGQWQEIPSDILDGLIAREIFLTSDCSEPDLLDPPNLKGYYPLKEDKSTSHENERFVILPNSEGWQSIQLSLLLAGQVYRKVTENDSERYHQINPPILSTGEIVTVYNIEVSKSVFIGEMKELNIDWDKPSGVYQVVLPYPPIPSDINLSLREIQDWADAEDDGGNFPFYIKHNNSYLVGTEYHTPPYPYLPLSCF